MILYSVDNYWQVLWRSYKASGQEKLSYLSGQGEECWWSTTNDLFIFLLTCVQIWFVGSPSGLTSSEAAFVIKLCVEVVSLRSPAKCLQHLFGIGASSHQLVHINHSKGAALPSGWCVDFSFNTSGVWGELLPMEDHGSPLPIYQTSHPLSRDALFLLRSGILEFHQPGWSSQCDFSGILGGMYLRAHIYSVAYMGWSVCFCFRGLISCKTSFQ